MSWEDPFLLLKWRPVETSGTFALRFNTVGLPYATAAASLQNNGFRTVGLRVTNLTDLPEGTTLEQRNGEVIKLLTELNRQDVKVYLWKSQEFQRGDVDGGAYPKHPGADEFITEMSALITKAKSAGVAGALQGVMPVDTNLDDCDQVRERALYIATGINAQTGDWLKTRTLTMPGAGMGAYFKSIHNGGTSWLTQMKAQTGYFAFLYKHQPNRPEPVCKLGQLNKGWDSNVGAQARTTVAQQISYLRTDMGLADLEKYMHGNGRPR